ncbi:site-specific DNA-methyltransferase [Candidatus Poribacteria bacterium]|nr:site-specific DNA-methyltransferase [Candidatus Poribacteria bacterium]
MSELNSPTSVIYTLDNLRVLRGLNSECIDLIYLDPPFNTGKQWHAPIGERGEQVGFNDIWGWDRVTGETLEQTIARQWEEERDYAGTAVREIVEAAIAAHSPQMGSYCAWMAPRLIEMERVLKPTGTLYLHCDPFADGYLRLMLDAIFGYRRFRNEIAWCYRGGGGEPKAELARKLAGFRPSADGTTPT